MRKTHQQSLVFAVINIYRKRSSGFLGARRRKPPDGILLPPGLCGWRRPVQRLAPFGF
jgi:hypothetical protein